MRLSVAAVAAAMLVSCGGGGVPSDRLLVVVTTSPYGDVVRNVAGDEADVEVLIPTGADAHEYVPSASQIAMMARADLVVTGGLGLEAGMSSTIAQIGSEGANVIELGGELDPVPFADRSGVCDPSVAGDESTDGGAVACDPHLWMDPLRMIDAADLVAAELDELDPNGGWLGRAAGYADELRDADAQIRATLAGVADEQRLLVTNHEALGYFATRYGFRVVGVVIPGGSTLAQPSSAELAALTETMRRLSIRAVFAETVEPATLAEALASEVGEGVVVVELYTESLGEPSSGADTLIGMLIADAELIEAALS